MCTLYTFEANQKVKFSRRINEDWRTNDDGGSILMIDAIGNVVSRLQTTSRHVLLSAIASSKAARYVVHLRMSTGVVGGVSGCHMFDSPDGGFIYCHNGVTSKGDSYRVDSLVFGEQFDTFGAPCDVVEFGRAANLIVYNCMTNEIVIHRGDWGSLHTDCNGNWSTKTMKGFQSVDVAGWYKLDGSFISKTKYPKETSFSLVRYRTYDYSAWLKKCDLCGEEKYTTKYDPNQQCECCQQCSYYFGKHTGYVDDVPSSLD
jgi:hypothetical protein